MHNSRGRRWTAFTALTLALTLATSGLTAQAAPTLDDAPAVLTTTPVPKISGTPRVGAPLVAKPGTWKPAGVVFSYSWAVNGVVVEGATEPTFRPTPSHKGGRVTAIVTGSLEGYMPISKTSARTAVIAAGILSGPVPTVTGSRRVGETLTAAPGSWAQSEASFSYQWLRNGKKIKNATSDTLKLVAADKATVITVSVKATLAGYTSATKTSSKKVAKVAAGVIVRPNSATIEGEAAVGSPLTAASDWPTGVALSYQWRVANKPVAKATAATFVPAAAHLNKAVSVVITGKRSGYTTITVTAVASEPVAQGVFRTAPVPATSSSVVGKPIVVTTGTFAPKATSFSYVWLRNGVAISGATKSTYTPQPNDLGATITVELTAHATGIASLTQTSTAGAAVVPGVLSVKTAPKVSGTAKVSSVLSSTSGTWSTGATSYSFQWFVADVAVPGATSASYLVRPTDADRVITVRVTASGTGYAAAAATSSASQKVVGKVYSLCSALNVDYPYGVRKSGVTYDTKAGVQTPFGLNAPFESTSVYTLNKSRDGDKDGIACEGATSEPPVAPLALTSTPTPTISGQPSVGSTLSTVSGSWQPAPVALNYQWLANSVPISGATGQTYTVSSSNLGSTIAVSITGSKTGYTSVTKTSANTAAVQSAPSGPIVIGGTLTADTVLDSTNPKGYRVTSDLVVPAGVELLVEEGTVVKFNAGYGLTVYGSLVSSGTAQSPVVFTSVKDDTVGGDTNGDGVATTPAAGNWGGISVAEFQRAGSLTLDYTTVAFSGGVFTGYSTADKVVVRNSVVKNSSGAGISVSVYRAGQDNGTAVVEISDTTVQDTAGRGIYVSASGDPVGEGTQIPVPVVQNNTVNRAGSAAIVVSGETLDGTLLRGNAGTGSKPNQIQIDGTITTSLAVPLGGLPLGIGQSSGSGLTIAKEASMTVAAGSIIKSYSYALQVYGSLVSSGTAQSPVVFTSVKDDTVGGDTNGDGVATTPAAGNWGGIGVVGSGNGVNNGSVNLTGTTLKYATIALEVSGGAEAYVRGSFVGSQTAIWSDGTLVDARDIDWGSAAGPSSTDVVGSGVVTLPWVGYVAPPRPAVATPQPVASGNNSSCAKYTVFGLRGSEESPQGEYTPSLGLGGTWATPSFSGTTDGFGNYNTQVFNTFKQVNGGTMKQIAVQYQALPVPVVDKRVTPNQYNDSIFDGADKLIARMNREEIDCPSTKFVVLGYSQGALAAHIALRVLDKTDQQMLAKVVGVGLVSDPGRVMGANESWWRTASYENGTLSQTVPTLAQNASAGVWASAFLMTASANGPLPDGVAARTKALCHAKDVVCGTYLTAGIKEHTNYTANELVALGRMLAADIN